MSQRPPLRILVALALTVVAVAALGVGALVGNDAPSSTTTTSTTTAAVLAPTTEVTETSVQVAPDWYPKGSSRYSDRRPAVTITTLAPTTTDEPEA